MSLNGDQPAFPASVGQALSGLTKREHCALEFATAMVANPHTSAQIATGVANIAEIHGQADAAAAARGCLIRGAITFADEFLAALRPLPQEWPCGKCGRLTSNAVNGVCGCGAVTHAPGAKPRA